MADAGWYGDGDDATLLSLRTQVVRLEAVCRHFAGIYDSLIAKDPNLPGDQLVGITMDELKAAREALQ